MYVEAWQVRATAILVIAMVLVFGYYFFALVLSVVALAATFVQIGPGNTKRPCEGPPADAVEVRFDSKTEEVAPPDPIDALDVDSKQEQAKTWTDSVMLADTGVAMPAAQVARAWLQMARSKDIVLAPSKPRPSRPVRAGSSSDLCGSITEGDTDPCSEVTPRGRRTLVVDIERADRAEPWGFQWRPGTRRWILDSVEDNSLASAWNQQQTDRGFRSLQLGSTLLEANGSKHKVVVKQELDTALHLQLTFLLPDEGLIERLDAQSLECRIKNSFLEVTAADSHDERRNFSDPGPIIAKSVSSAPEGYGSCGGPVDNTGGYVTESEAVSDLIGSTALIVGAAPHTGKFCRIEAFDPQVRRYVVRVYADGGPVSAKLRLENLMLQPSLPSFPAPVTSFQDYPAPLPVQPEAVLNPYSPLPWSWPEAPPVFPMGPSVSDAMLMQNLPHPWAPVGDASWSQYGYDGYGMPTMLGSEISMEGPPMLPCMQPSVPTLPPLSTTPFMSLPFPFEGPATLPSDRPLMIHTHQALDQQAARQHMDLEEELIAQAAQSEVKSAEALELQDPQGFQGHPGEHPGELLCQDRAVEPAGTEPEVKKKRRRRRRGKRKGQKTDAADAEEQDSGSEDLDPTIGPAAAQACDVVHAKDEAEPDGFAKADHAGFTIQAAQAAQGAQESWRPRLPKQFETDMEQEGAEGIQGAKDFAEADVAVSLHTERWRAADWRPSLPRSLVPTRVANEKADGVGNLEVPQPDPMESKPTPWQPSLHRAKLHKQDHIGANPKGSDGKKVY